MPFCVFGMARLRAPAVHARLALQISAVDWAGAILAAWGGGKIEKSSPGWCTASMVADADKGEFTLKLKETGLQTGINFLREKGCFPDGDDSDDDVCYGNDFEW